MVESRARSNNQEVSEGKGDLFRVKNSKALTLGTGNFNQERHLKEVNKREG